MRIAEKLKQYGIITFGCALYALGFCWCCVPGHMSIGGLTGVAQVLNVFFPRLPVGVMTLVMNVPLFILGWRQEGRDFIVRTLLSTVLLSLALDTLKFPRITEDPMLSALFGGVILGLGLGLVFMSDATTGGTDLAAKMIQRRLPRLSMAWVLFGLDMIVPVAAMIAFSPEEGLYALITIYVGAKIADFMLEGMRSARAFTVVSPHHEAIARRVMIEMNRGVTCWNATGMYSGQEVTVLYCVVSNREVTRVKHIILSEDKNAFIVIADAHEVGGEGFTFNRPTIPLLPRKRKP